MTCVREELPYGSRHRSTGADWLDTTGLVLPVFPTVAHRALKIASNPDVTVAQLAGIVAKDQVLATRVLALANSAASASIQPISNLTEAIIRLGIGTVRNAIVMVAFASRLKDPRLFGERGRNLVDHAIGTAYLAHLTAERAGTDADEAFLCGLLHDIGKLVVLKLAHDHHRRTGLVIPAELVEIAIVEQHAALGGLALRRWKLPEELDEPVTCHHEYRSAPYRLREAAVTYAANRLSHRYGFGCDADGNDLLEDEVSALLGLDAPWLAATDAHAPGLFHVARQTIG